ncbi:MAG: hypothetical protein K2X91_12990 [Thermoleophilia bacterium]|nr:hypothetical protein [Thermoleophilia bacterium]
MDLSSRRSTPAPDQTSPRPAAAPSDPPRGAGEYLRVYFLCSNNYTRAQKTPAGDAYTARCAACGRCKRFVIGESGTSQRSFVLTCR